MSENYAIRVKDISKIYKLYERNSDRLKDALGFSKHSHYREHYALHHLSFDIHRGETVGIIGTNGAGKSTILKIITGVVSPTEGSLEIDGRISALLELGAGFNQEYTGLENIYLNGTMMGYTREEVDAKLDSILSFADIGEFVHQPVKMYSSGMFVRLAFALAINIDPEILVVDEALSVGDVFFQNKCYKKFDDFKAEGKTILFVSHDLSSITKYCDRVILLNKGQMLAEGTPKDMVNLYKKILTGAGEEIDAFDRLQEKDADGFPIDRADEGTESGAGKTDGSGVPADKEISAGTAGHQTAAGSAGSGTNAPAGGSTSGIAAKHLWKSHYRKNPDVEEYGDRQAEIIDYAVLDDGGRFSSSIIKGTRFTIKSKIHFNEDVKDPIFTFTFKTIKGVDVTGTNTMFEKVVVPLAKAGETYVASFEQDMNLQGGEYLLSLSCTGFINGELHAYHRCYDLLNITVISDKNTVGFYDMNSVTTVEKC